jgi:formylglycine-generating enzyme required for sulfatase activity/serine/threonine protein kinase
MPLSKGDDDGLTVDALFAAWIASIEAGELVYFVYLCRARPFWAHRLCQLREQWRGFQGILSQAGLAGSYFGRLRAKLRRAGEPRVAPEPPASSSKDSDASTDFLRRLARRGPVAKRYRMQGEIAHGGMGAILRAWDEDLRRPIAMKVALGKASRDGPNGDALEDRSRLARFLEEAQVTGQLEHPGVVPVHELGLDDEGRVYFTMKLVEGRHFGEVLDLVGQGQEDWTQTRALGVIQKVCDAMAYAHSRGVVHRDLKPANVMVGRFGEVYVMDWGLARILGEGQDGQARVESEREAARELDPSSPLHTRQGAVMGTLAYMPPEQALGRIEEIGPAADVYAVGSMLYHLLAGHPPYIAPGTKPTDVDVWLRVKAGPPTGLSAEAREAPAELVAICERAMARDAKHRYASMAALAEDLTAFVEVRVVNAYESGPWAEAKKWIQRNKPLASSLAMGLLFALGGLGGVAAVQANGRKELDVQADLFRLPYLEQEAQGLWPALPAKIPALEGWLDSAEELAARLELHRKRLDDLRAHALVVTDSDLERERRMHPLSRELDDLDLLEKAKGAVLQASTESSPQRESLESELEDIDRRIGEVRSQLGDIELWRFATPELQLEHDTLARTVEALEAFADPASGLVADVRARLAWARSVEERTLSAFASQWQRAADEVRSAGSPYVGMKLVPQLGLVPLGRDPSTGLQEFVDLRSGDVPERDGASGSLAVNGSTGIVFVLLPGGRFLMGAQKDSSSNPGFSPWAYPNEGPPHEVQLSPFLVSKYELNRGQWNRLSGGQAAAHEVLQEPQQQAHPVSAVSWQDCSGLLARFGLALPTEAQWEYAARAGATTSFPESDDPESLAGSVNLADKTAIDERLGWPQAAGMEWLDDGFAHSSPVGNYAANPFGLYDVLGNVWEWCRDGAGSYSLPHRPMDGLIVGGAADVRVARGGGYLNNPYFARLSIRDQRSPSFDSDYHGLRPVRELTLP